MSLFHALILGIVEGITEFLPISSTAHLILTSHLLRLAESEFIKSFEIIIQLGAILSVVVLYWSRFWNRDVLKKLVVHFGSLVRGLIQQPLESGIAGWHGWASPGSALPTDMSVRQAYEEHATSASGTHRH